MPLPRHPTFVQLLMLVVTVLSAAAPAVEPAGEGPLLLRDGWKLASSATVTDPPEAISAPSYALGSHWLNAVVPGTVLTSYIAAGIYPDPYVGLNNKLFFKNPDKGDFTIERSAIPDASMPGSPFAAAHWYRTGFTIPEGYSGKTVWLKFDGIHWRATYYLNGTSLGTVTGAYQRGIFNVTDRLQPGVNILAVKIDPLPSPGRPKDRSCGGDRKIGNSPAAIYANVGWDFSFVDGVRDRSIGILRDVTLYATGPVDIRDPVLSTEGIPTDVTANLNFRTTLVNSTAQTQSGQLVVEFGTQRLTQDITLAPSEVRDLKLSHRVVPALVYPRPHLWWPNGRGEPHLEDLKVHFQPTAGVPSQVQRRFGIRSVENRVEQGQWVCWVNGQRLFLAGGNWVQDAMQRQTAEREEAQVRLIRAAGLNWLRLWSASGPLDDAFFAACDRQGILVWAEANLAEQVNNPKQDPAYVQITLDNWGDYIQRIRSHACVFNYVGCNEGAHIKGGPDIPGMEAVARDNDGSRPYSGSSQFMGQRGAPYRWIGIKGFYDYTNKDLFGAGPMGLFGGFCNETGAPGLPVGEVLQDMLPGGVAQLENRELVNYLDGGGFHRMYEFIGDLSRFGDPAVPDLAGRTGFANVGLKGQLLNAQIYRAMGEQWQRHKWDEKGRFATGYALWTVNNTHPQICSRIYDYSLEANASLYFLAHANKALHVQYNYQANDITAINNGFKSAENLNVQTEIHRLDGIQVWSGKAVLKSLLAETAVPGLISIPTAADLKLTEAHFIRCRLLTQDGRVVDDTWYWRSAHSASFGTEGDFTSLSRMPGSRLAVTTATTLEEGRRQVRVDLENRTDKPAFFVRMKLLDTAGTLIRPCLYSDNYLTLAPGERTTVEVACPASLKQDPTVVVEGWNVGILTLGASARGETPSLH